MQRMLFTLCLLPFILSAQDGTYNLGARNAGLAGTSVTISDSWAVFNNPGALGSVKTTSIMATYQNRYNISGFNVVGGGFVYHQPLFNTALKYYKFGDDLFNQQLIGLTIANRFQMVSLGAGVNIIQTHAEGLSNRRVWTMEMGGTAEITKQLVLGAHIFNFKNGQVYPTTMKAGLSFRPRDFLMINVEIQKQIDSRGQFKSGLEYEVIKNIYIRTGVNVQNNEVTNAVIRGTFGFGFHPKNLLFDYAFTNQNLGAINEISLTYNLKQSK